MLAFGHQYLQWQVESHAGCGLHQRRAGFGAAEYEQLGVGHGQADLGGFAAVVHHGEQHDPLGLQKVSESCDGLLDRMMALLGNDPVVGGHGELLAHR